MLEDEVEIEGENARGYTRSMMVFVVYDVTEDGIEIEEISWDKSNNANYYNFAEMDHEEMKERVKIRLKRKHEVD